MYTLQPLSYGYSDLEPYIDTHTLGLHYNKHQRNYLNNLNELLKKVNYDFRYPIEELSKHIEEFPLGDREDILFNLGGVINHYIYFNSMSPNNRKNIDGVVKEGIIRRFGSYNNFKDIFKKAALSLKGSGYTFLVLDQNDNLRIINLANQENPYSYNLTPLIGIDMWEHAYYINYQNKKDSYIDNFFDIIDFGLANKIYNSKLT